MLITAQEILTQQRLGQSYLLIDVREEADWRSATLPGAANMNVYDYFIPDCTAEGLAAMAASFQAEWRRLAQNNSGIPVFFERQVGMRSPRGAWFAWLIGREDALILDGGVDAWLAAGGTLRPGNGARAAILAGDAETTPPAPLTARQRSWVASRDEIRAADDIVTVILDVRRPAEFDGSFVHDCCHRAGRIPGARLLFWQEVIEDGHFLPGDRIAELAAGVGLSPQQRIMIYCHRGARAATVLAALRLAGYQNLAVYVGSWHEWAEHAELPLLTGAAQ
ncbi:sulfurtransferase [Brenneria tiliae]|uniref:Sulfurtransferase n=1 Tax=Brenneria tiliae TaxID=2914984 RepID=A0ABT0N116_9GAMM|nr:rhodanese-like domain-containing protein [Brenneria tiliae]MCL2895785.1 sulfurtransferase [Brenneria tiliae]